MVLSPVVGHLVGNQGHSSISAEGVGGPDEVATTRQTTVWLDAGGRTTAILLTTNAGAAVVNASVASFSNAGIQQAWEGPLVVAVPAPVAAQYPGVLDRATLFFSTAAGSVVKVQIPAPLASIFLADQETVDPAVIAALIALVIANVVTDAGVPVTSYIGGTRF